MNIKIKKLMRTMLEDGIRTSLYGDTINHEHTSCLDRIIGESYSENDLIEIIIRNQIQNIEKYIEINSNCEYDYWN